MKTFIFGICLLLLLGCQSRSEKNSGSFDFGTESTYVEEAKETSEDYSSQSEQSNSQQTSTNDTIPKAQKIIKDGSINFEVENIEKAKTSVDAIIKRFNAYYEKETFHSDHYESSFSLIIRVSAAEFEALIKALESGGHKTLFKEILARDVTEEFMDLSTRLENNKAYLKRYNELLSSAKSVKDILEIQEKIRAIEEEMDAKKGRIKYINDRVNFSRLNLSLVMRNQDAEMSGRNFGKQIVNALSGGFNLLLDFILVLFNLWPFILLGFGIFMFRKRIIGIFRRK